MTSQNIAVAALVAIARVALPSFWLAIALAGCVGDPACRGRNAADLAPSAERYRAMSALERRQDAEAFNALARRCGWEP